MSKQKAYGLAARKAERRAILLCLYLGFVGILGLAAMCYATQRIAALYGYHPALGEPLGAAFGQYWYWPWFFQPTRVALTADISDWWIWTDLRKLNL